MRVILIKYGELTTKKGNRNFFIQKLTENLAHKLKKYEVNLINDLLPVLNKAVHADLNQLYEVDWVISNGIALLAQLENIYNK